jgi:hypothetical protein
MSPSSKVTSFIWDRGKIIVFDPAYIFIPISRLGRSKDILPAVTVALKL